MKKIYLLGNIIKYLMRNKKLWASLIFRTIKPHLITYNPQEIEDLYKNKENISTSDLLKLNMKLTSLYTVKKIFVFTRLNKK